MSRRLLGRVRGSRFAEVSHVLVQRDRGSQQLRPAAARHKRNGRPVLSGGIAGAATGETHYNTVVQLGAVIRPPDSEFNLLSSWPF